MCRKILVVDDEREIGELVRDYLEAAEYQVILAFDGHEGIRCWKNHRPDMAILDIMLPKINGMEICRRIRMESNIPILMLSAKKSEEDKVIGLNLGADDYITKPFSPKELVARVNAHFRRLSQMTEEGNKQKLGDRLAFRDLLIDFKGHSLKVRGEDIPLSAKEFEVLNFFLNANEVLTRKKSTIMYGAIGIWRYKYRSCPHKKAERKDGGGPQTPGTFKPYGGRLQICR